MRLSRHTLRIPLHKLHALGFVLGELLEPKLVIGKNFQPNQMILSGRNQTHGSLGSGPRRLAHRIPELNQRIAFHCRLLFGGGRFALTLDRLNRPKDVCNNHAIILLIFGKLSILFPSKTTTQEGKGALTMFSRPACSNFTRP